jgi:hypothetical protein
MYRPIKLFIHKFSMESIYLYYVLLAEHENHQVRTGIVYIDNVGH